MLSGRAKLMGYAAAGNDFLADRIADMFQRIDSPEKQALHNVIVDEVMSMVEGNEKMFFQCLQEKLLEQKRMTFARKVAEAIKLVGKG